MYSYKQLFQRILVPKILLRFQALIESKMILYYIHTYKVCNCPSIFLLFTHTVIQICTVVIATTYIRKLFHLPMQSDTSTVVVLEHQYQNL